MSESPSNEVLANMISNIGETMKAHIESTDKNFNTVIKTQESFNTKQEVANGRVSKLEIHRAEMIASYSMAIKIMGFGLPTILAMFWFLLSLQFSSFTREIGYEIDRKIQANSKLYFEDPQPTPIYDQTKAGR